MQEQDLAVIILAAGKGTRMQNSLAKVLIPVAGKPTLEFVLDTVATLNPSRTLVVVGHQADRVQEIFSNRDLEFVLQKKQLGLFQKRKKKVRFLQLEFQLTIYH